MALPETQAEPSMEEILASIRRIISEEEQAPAAEPVLDLTQHAEPEGVNTSEDDLVFEAVEEVVAAAAPARIIEEAPMAVTAPVRAQAPAPAPATSDTIISSPTASAAAGSLSRLAGSLRISDAAGQTVEGVVRELLKPMLKEWLEQNLPAIVEARVEAELERIARMAH
jgi:cell pole-organizing protein PopZ